MLATVGRKMVAWYVEAEKTGATSLISRTWTLTSVNEDSFGSPESVTLTLKLYLGVVS